MQEVDSPQPEDDQGQQQLNGDSEDVERKNGEGVEMLNCRRLKYLSIDDGPDERTALRAKLETFDDALPHVGDFGRYQVMLLFALLPFSVAYATLYFSQFFFTLVPKEHWCKVDELIDGFTQEQRYYKMTVDVGARGGCVVVIF